MVSKNPIWSKRPSPRNAIVVETLKHVHPVFRVDVNDGWARISMPLTKAMPFHSIRPSKLIIVND